MFSNSGNEWGPQVSSQARRGMKYGNLASAMLVGGVFCLTPIASAVAQVVAEQAAAAQDDAKGQAIESVTVSGYRMALDAAQRAKRTSSVVVEAITPEDLGKFTDNSIADQMQRVPGVQIDRGTDGRSGDHVSVRGIGAQYITTTINGRTPGGYGKEGQQFLRQFAVDVLPSEVLSGVRVYKSASAEMVEAGMGGAVDYQTLRPLDYKTKDGKAYFGSATVKAQQNQGTGGNDFGKAFSGIIGGHLADNTFGFVISGLSSKNPFQMDSMEATVNQHDLNVRNADGSISHPSVIYPESFTVGRSRRNDKRDAVSVGLQWKPTADLDVNFDYLTSKFNRPDNRDGYVTYFNSNNALDGTFLPGGVTIDHGAVTGLDFTKYIPPNGASGLQQSLGFPIGYNNNSKTEVGGLNVKWRNDKWTFDADVSGNKTRTLQDLEWTYAAVNASSFNGTNYTANASGPATINAGAPAITQSDLNTIGALQRFFKTKNDGAAARFGASYELSDHATLKAGYRYSYADVDVRNAYTASFAFTPAQVAALKGVLYPGGTDTLMPGHNIGQFGTVPSQNPNGIDWRAFFPAFDFSKGPLGGDFWNASQAQGPWSASADPAIGYLYANKEKIHAAFAQLDFDTVLFGMPAEGNVGLRVVRTNERSRAFQTVTTRNDVAGTQLTTQDFLPAETASSHTNVLPAFNLNLHPSDEQNLRFSVSQTMSRPEYLDMAPNNNLTVPSTALHQSDRTIVGTGTTGNSNLKPATSWNFDTTFEQYTQDGASYVGSIFYKRVNDFIAPTVTYNATLPGYGDQLFNLTQPQNLSSGHVVGVELGLNQPLKRLIPVLDGFGIQANYTYVSSAIDQPISGQKMTFPGVSKHNVNGTVYYSKDKLDARVSFVYRTAYLSQFPWAGYVPYPLSTDASMNVDASLTYKLTDKLDLTLTGTNLTRENRRDYLFNKAVFEHYFTVPRTFAIALRASL